MSVSVSPLQSVSVINNPQKLWFQTLRMHDPATGLPDKKHQQHSGKSNIAEWHLSGTAFTWRMGLLSQKLILMSSLSTTWGIGSSNLTQSVKIYLYPNLMFITEVQFYHASGFVHLQNAQSLSCWRKRYFLYDKQDLIINDHWSCWGCWRLMAIMKVTKVTALKIIMA